MGIHHGGNVIGTYYVAPRRNDANSGNYDSPWRTIGYGVTRLSPSDTLVVLPDTGRERPLIVGGNNLRAGVDLSGVIYVWIENLEFTHTMLIKKVRAHILKTP